MTLEVQLARLSAADNLFPTKFHLSSDGGGSDRFALDAAVSRTGTPAIRVTVDRDHPANGYRSEWSSSTTFHHPAGETFWFSMSVYVPPGHQFDSVRCIVAQLHDEPDEGDNAGPAPMLLYIDTDRRWHLDLLYNTQPAGEQTPGGNVKVVDQAFARVRPGWHDFLWQFRSDYSGDGLFRLWHDGLPWLRYAGPLAYNNAEGWYSKCGIYMTDWRTAPEVETDTRVQRLWFDEIRIGTAAETVASMRVPVGNPDAARIAIGAPTVLDA